MTKKTVIDEELVRRAIGNTPSILDADPPPFDERIIKTVEDSDEAPQAAERRRRILLPDFERRFMARTGDPLPRGDLCRCRNQAQDTGRRAKDRTRPYDRNRLCGQHSAVAPRNLPRRDQPSAQRPELPRAALTLPRGSGRPERTSSKMSVRGGRRRTEIKQRRFDSYKKETEHNVPSLYIIWLFFFRRVFHWSEKFIQRNIVIPTNNSNRREVRKILACF